MPTSPTVLASQAGPSAVHAAKLPAQLLFLPSETGTVDIYSLSKPTKPLQTISGFHGGQQQMDVDISGDLLVVNNGSGINDNFVGVYAPPYDQPPTILNTVWQGRTLFPVGVTVDPSGTVYVSDCGKYCGDTGAVYVYPKGATSPTSQITAAGFDSLGGLAADAAGNVYLVNYIAETSAVDVWKLPAGSQKFAPMHLRGLTTGNGGNGPTLDAAGDLYVANNSSGSDYIAEFKPGKRNASRIIDSMPFTQAPEMIDIGPDNNLYVPVDCGFAPCPAAYAFAPRGKKAFETIGTAQAGTGILGIATAPNLQLEGSR
jgi:hypothetical protein